ncbi:transcription initiation factor IIA subunit 2-like [Oppia nitens]|uniref:transcription initiation factor IIA subunit 2-like n=1 Tax=Oppia nitens TaxID=1686743 RepID=UPI0023DAC26C|nr:transcription initiation factor IIA subunit 2-like [Oppia nitens]
MSTTHQSSYLIYRETTIGRTLIDTLIELSDMYTFSHSLLNCVLNKFDQSMNDNIAIIDQLCQTSDNNIFNANCRQLDLTFQANKLNVYRFHSNVWTLVLTDVQFICYKQLVISADKVKIVAIGGVDSSSSSSGKGSAAKRKRLANQHSVKHENVSSDDSN